MYCNTVISIDKVLLLVLLLTTTTTHACTDILVTPSASEDGSAMIAYNADAPTVRGCILPSLQKVLYCITSL